MIDLAKVQQSQPQLVSLAKSAAVNLEKVGLSNHQAAVLLVMDVSGSTGNLYANGSMQRVADQAFCMALHFDDDGEVPVCFFESRAHDGGDMSLRNYSGYIDTARRGLTGGTNYASAIRWVREKSGFVSGGAAPKRGFLRKHAQTTPTLPAQQPTYVLFVTDGDDLRKDDTRRELIAASHEPIFFQFIGVGGSERFQFLEELDDMPGRFIDNANFFQVNDPRSFSDDQMYQSLLGEYPQWLVAARQHGLIV